MNDIMPQPRCLYKCFGLPRRDIRGAIEWYRSYLNGPPQEDFIHAWNHLGDLLMDYEKDNDGAIYAYKKSLELNTTNPVIWNRLAVLQENKNNSPDVEAQPECFNRAQTLAKQRNIYGAIVLYSSYLKDPHPQYSLRAWNNLGHLLMDRGRDIAGAEHAFKKALEIDPKDAPSWNDLGNLLTDKKDLADAEHAYKKALEIDPEAIDVWGNLGNMLLDHTVDYDGAIIAFKKMLEINPKCTEAKDNLYYIAENLCVIP